MNKKYLDRTGLTDILQKLKAKFASLVHTHKKEDITDYIVDTELSSTSTNPVENKTIKAGFDLVDYKIQTDIDSLRNEFKTYVDEMSPGVDAEHNHDDKYYTEAEIDAKLDEAKQYANNIKDDLLNGAGEAYDTLKELGELIDENVDAIEALETIATNKADKDHNHDEVYEKKEDAELKYDELKVKDWNQNDETASDYVKNRTHWVEIGEFNTIFNETTKTYIDFSNPEVGRDYIYSDESYTVIVDGVQYKCTGYLCDEGTYVCLGDSRLITGFDFSLWHEEDVPFCVMWDEYNEILRLFYPDTETHTLSVGTFYEEYHALDERFIPYSIARTDELNYVDERINGVSDRVYELENKTIEVSWNDLTDKPFGTEGEREIVITTCPDYDFSNSDPTLEFYESEDYHIRAYCSVINHHTEDRILVEGKEYSVSWDNQTYTVTAYEWDDPEMDGASFIVLGDEWLNETPFFIRDGYGDMAVLTNSSEQYHTFNIFGDNQVVVKKLDEQYIPETIARVSDIDEKIAAIPTPDVSGQIDEHNSSDTAHEDIRKLIDELPDPIEIDNTLKVEGAAADAKVVGDELSSCRVDITRIKEEALTIQNMPYSISDLNSESVNPYQWHTPIVYGNGKYVAVGETHFTTSVDGINWETPKLHSHDGDYVKGAYGNGKFVFVSNSNKYGYPITIYTEDCVTWNYIALPTEQPIPVIDIIFENGMFVKLYNRIGEGLSPVSYSTDGINWNFSNPYSYSENEYQAYGTNKIIYKDNKFIIPIFDAPHSADTSRVETEGIVVFKYLILYSTDCINWNEYITQVPVSIELLETDVASERIISVIFTDEKCIAISEKRTFYTSTNGLDWVISSNLLPLINYRGNQIQIPWNFITYNSNKHLFVLLFEVFFAYSSDGEIWHASDENSDGVGIYRYIVSGGDKFIAQNTETGIIAFSNDAIDWNFAIPSVNTYYGENKTDSLKEAIGINNVAYMDKEDNEDIPDEPEAVIEVVDPMTATRVGSAADAYKTRQAIESMSVGGSASDISFDNSESDGMSSATNVQDAIVEIGTALGEVYQSFSTAANAIGDALVAKGVSVPEGTSLTDMSALISSNLVNSSSADVIKNALIAKGVSVSNNASLSDLATLITNNLHMPPESQSGTVTYVGKIQGGSDGYITITFPKAFSKAPTVSGSVRYLDNNGNAYVSTGTPTFQSVTQTGCVAKVRAMSSSHHTTYVDWTAIAK